LLYAIDCSSCGYVHLIPLPFPGAIDAYYGSFDAEYDNDDGNAWLKKEWQEHKLGLWDARYRFEKQLLGDGPLLDVGAGGGWFVEWWRKQGCGADGIEPSKTAREFNRNVKLYATFDEAKAKLEQVPLRSLRFSLVLEHVVDPAELLDEYLQLLEPGGKVLIIVPNEFNPLQRQVAKRDGNWFLDARHINYFTPSSLRELLLKLGLKVEYEAVTFPTELWRLAGFGYDTAGRRLHRWRLRLEKLAGPGVFAVYKRLYDRWGWGRELMFVARREW
jgi:SAM-dependent methyltransferase